MRYRKTFEFAETQEQAKALCERLNASASQYIRKNKPATFTSWQSKDKNDKAHYVVWYYA